MNSFPLRHQLFVIYDGNDITIALGVKPNGSSTKVGFMASVEDASGNQFPHQAQGLALKMWVTTSHTQQRNYRFKRQYFGRLMTHDLPDSIMLQLTRMEMVKHQEIMY